MMGCEDEIGSTAQGSSIVTPTGSVSIQEVAIDPPAAVAGDSWVLRLGTIGSPIGLLLALTNSKFIYKFSYKTLAGPVVRTTLE